MRLSDLVPPVVRSTVPERLVARYIVYGPVDPPSRESILRVLGRVAPDLVPNEEAAGPALRLTWRRTVLVLGLVQRPVEETVELWVTGPPVASLELYCVPQALHDAHAAGFGGVLAFTAATGLAANLPAAAAMLLAGSMLAFMAREHSFLRLGRQLEQLVLDLGETLWSGQPGQVEFRILTRELS